LAIFFRKLYQQDRKYAILLGAQVIAHMRYDAWDGPFTATEDSSAGVEITARKNFRGPKKLYSRNSVFPDLKSESTGASTILELYVIKLCSDRQAVALVLLAI